MNISISISDKIKGKIGSVRLALLGFEAHIEPSNPDFWTRVSEASQKLRSTIKSDEITKINTISETRHAYKRCGKDPSRYRPSADSLIRRIVKGNELYRVNNVVDVLNLVSLQSGISIGGYDVDKITGKAILTIGAAEDEYVGIGRGALNIDGLPVLRDSQSVFGSPTSDSERTMIAENSKNIAFVFFDFGMSEEIPKAVENCKTLLVNYCGITDFFFELVEE